MAIPIVWLPIFLIVLALPTGAEAEPMSFRCDGPSYSKTEPKVYFITLDIEKRHFVFEVPGGNISKGEIISENDERLELSLRGDGGRILLSYKRKSNTLIWPGISAGELGRHLLQLTCNGISDRTVLSYFYQEQFDPKRRDPVDAFSVRCPGKTDGFYFITMDRVTKTVVVETEHFSGSLSGDITSVEDDAINITFGRGPLDPNYARWDERKRIMTFLGKTDKSSVPVEVLQCIVTKPRSILDGIDWESLQRRGF